VLPRLPPPVFFAPDLSISPFPLPKQFHIGLLLPSGAISLELAAAVPCQRTAPLASIFINWTSLIPPIYPSKVFPSWVIFPSSLQRALNDHIILRSDWQFFFYPLSPNDDVSSALLFSLGSCWQEFLVAFFLK